VSDSIRNRNLTIGLVIALLFLGLGLDRLGYMTPVRVMVQTLVQPAQEMVSDAAGRADNVVQRRERVEKLRSDVTFLQTEVNRLTIENIQLKELERENQQLRELLNYTQNNPSFDYTTASVLGQVIGSDPSNLLYLIYIDVGARDGIAQDMPVITHRGLVGRISQVGPNYAQVLLLIDPVSSVNAVIQNSRVTGVVRGELGGTLILERMPQGVTVMPGDLVLTSGLGGNFPDKLVIGQITEVFQRDLDLFQTAKVRPTVDFSDLETVLVLTAFQQADFESEIQPGEETDN
jgi:rod shape-determining protein MreC